MVDRIGGNGKGPDRANGGGPDVVTLVKVRPNQTRSRLTRTGAGVHRDWTACGHEWRRTKRYCCNGLAFARIVWPPFSSVRTATADIAIAVRCAASGPDASSGGEPINVISAAQKGGSIIAIGSASTGSGSANNVRA